MRAAPDLRALRFFAIVVGNGRSGTHLSSSLVSAHPEALMAIHGQAANMVQDGMNWPEIAAALIENALRFQANPQQQNPQHNKTYDYAVPAPPPAGNPPLRVLGDKGIWVTLLENAALQRFSRTIPVPLRFLHCIRHPFDCIAAKAKRSKRPLSVCMDEYFDRESRAGVLVRRAGGGIPHRIYLEQLIAEPCSVLRGVFDYLELQADAALLSACASILFEAPEPLRFEIEFPPEARAEVARRTRALPHLHRYLDSRGELPFDAAPEAPR